ncbi:MAG: HAMP domain-containing sensor histidine kinase [Marinobacter sp.]|uniref:sensor histidine kinase n=1 Tax=Marinobacter sp. TaxID=50741 RepID=UPI00349FE67C
MPVTLSTPKRVFNSLRLTLVLSIVVPLLVLSGGAIAWGLSVVESRLDDRLREDLELVARAASGPLSRAMSEGDTIVLDDALKSIFRIGRVYGASIYDTKGDRVASLGVADSSVDRSQSAVQAIETGELGGAFRRVDGKAVFSQFTPLIAEDGRIKGLLQITRKRSDFQEQLTATRFWAIAIWSVLSLLVILVVVIGHYGSIGRHVSQLLTDMAALGPRHWRIPHPPSGPQEIRQIHLGLDAMAERMASAEQEINMRVERERDLAEQLQYQEKVAMIGRVAGGVAHELGAPLSVIEGRANILARTLDADSQKRHLGDITYQVRRMTLIIEQLLDCFRHVPNARRPLDLGKSLREVIVQVLADRRKEDRQLAVYGVDQLAWVLAEPTRLQLACLNILRNACQAARFRVEVRLLAVEGGWQVLVDDDGPGIEESLRQRIFEPFYSTRAAGEGTGLGLAVVSSVLKEHGGTIQVGDNDSGGCRMRLFWPAVQSSSVGEPV